MEYHFLDVTADTLNFDFLPGRIDRLAYWPGTINLTPFVRIKPEVFMADFNLKVLGAVKVKQALLPGVKQSDLASVVLFSTVAVKLASIFTALILPQRVRGRDLHVPWQPSLRLK